MELIPWLNAGELLLSQEPIAFIMDISNSLPMRTLVLSTSGEGDNSPVLLLPPALTNMASRCRFSALSLVWLRMSSAVNPLLFLALICTSVLLIKYSAICNKVEINSIIKEMFQAMCGYNDWL